MNRLGTMRRLALSVLLISTPSTAQPPPSPSNQAGALIMTQNCTICHGRELIESQRLTPQQWEKEIEKMVGWGSPLKEFDKKALLTYLSQTYPTARPRPPLKTHKPIK